MFDFLPNFAYLKLRRLAYQSLLDLSTEEGINASGKDEIYGCIFGRDSFLTILKILRAHQKHPDKKLLQISKKALLTLMGLQGKEFNIESGEAPGKFIHEFRKEKYEHLLALEKPWFLYPDKTLRNYDSIDSTPLGLIALYRYWAATKDSSFLIQVLPAVELALNWIITYGDSDKDSLLEYELHPDRKHGGLVVQSWTDSSESMRQEDGSFPNYPIAPVEVQGYAWLALKLWGNFYLKHSPSFGQKLLSQADAMKDSFNKLFLIEDEDLKFTAQALDGDKNQIKTITGNSLILLWATYQTLGKRESLLKDKYIKNLVQRAFMSDMFDPEGGIRTMSTKSKIYNPNEDSYHNGSFWPVLNGLIHEGLLNWGFQKEATNLKTASIKAISYFNSPIELYIKNQEGVFVEYKNSGGQVGCRVQAWSAATLLEMATQLHLGNLAFKPIWILWQQVLLAPMHNHTVRRFLETQSSRA